MAFMVCLLEFGRRFFVMFILQSLLLFGLAAFWVWVGGEGGSVTANNTLVSFKNLRKSAGHLVSPAVSQFIGQVLRRPPITRRPEVRGCEVGRSSLQICITSSSRSYHFSPSVTAGNDGFRNSNGSFSLLFIN